MPAVAPRLALRGIHAVVYALFDADEQLDRAAMRRQVAACLDAGCHGILALGLATEVAKLSEAERRAVMEWVAADTAGRVPLGFTIFGSSVAEQVAQVRAAEATGADWVLLQPPMVGSFAADEYVRFFGRVAASTNLPVGLQNAPAYMGRGLLAEEIRDLLTQHPNITVVKGEGPVIDIRRLIEIVPDHVAVFNGRGGLELTDNLRAGCAGLILAPDTVDHAVSIYDRVQSGDPEGAEQEYAALLPAIVFVMQSLETLICYGKRLFGRRAGIPIHDRAPALRPSPFGEDRVAYYAQCLGPYRRRSP